MFGTVPEREAISGDLLAVCQQISVPLTVNDGFALLSTTIRCNGQDPALDKSPGSHLGGSHVTEKPATCAPLESLLKEKGIPPLPIS
ncbi:hypothetical protein AVEN_76526-1 [Araneus ventricosus]|uniref:Uncharacterized protein n=1 Tax=Araneus ventricosus TaxID=182803 RepID=A0A4Y2CGN0_ARAVE|nr:hypothetical protein AVEN_76526-1 [Araneus ventricosus]